MGKGIKNLEGEKGDIMKIKTEIHTKQELTEFGYFDRDRTVITTSEHCQECNLKEEQLKKAEKVIEYYANLENWDFEEIDQGDVEFCEDTQANLGGKRARDFLLKLEGKCKTIE